MKRSRTSSAEWDILSQLRCSGQLSWDWEQINKRINPERVRVLSYIRWDEAFPLQHWRKGWVLFYICILSGWHSVERENTGERMSSSTSMKPLPGLTGHVQGTHRGLREGSGTICICCPEWYLWISETLTRIVFTNEIEVKKWWQTGRQRKRLWSTGCPCAESH